MLSLTLSRLMCLFVTLMLVVPPCSSQYHYSNWWHAGGKRNSDTIEVRHLREECGMAVEGLVNQFSRTLVKEVLKVTSSCARKSSLSPQLSENQYENLKKVEGQVDDKRWK